jgi:two-component system CheB/CheR fusion protein
MAKRRTNLTKESTQASSKKIKKTGIPKGNDFLVVGMGASAGGLEAFKEFFDAMPEAPGMAFVLVQHMDPTHKSLMAQLLKSHTKMQVMEVEDHTTVVPDSIFVIPPNKDMAIFNGVLHLMEPSVARGLRRPIDYFLRSLAVDQKERAVGIILSGTGSEGTLSLKDIKSEGGLSLVQTPESAKYDGMPRSAIMAGVEDFVLPVTEMPQFLLKYASKRTGKAIDTLKKPSTASETLEKIFILLRNETGCNFSDYKSSTVVRRIQKRMALNQIDSLEIYLKQLQKNKDEIRKLFDELLIGVTGFFRDPETYELLQQAIIAEIVKKKKDGETIRIWAPGCSTGEEAYSLVMLIDEAINQHNRTLKVQLFATDLDEKAINFARQGVYPDTIASDINNVRLKRYFLSRSHSFSIKKEIRDRVVFSVHNLIKDPPFSKLDMVSCRNLLIYLNVEAQRKVFAIFHYALNPGGILFLGSSESLGEYSSLFEVIDRKHNIYRHKRFSNTAAPDIGYLFREPRFTKSNINYLPKKERLTNLATLAERLLLVNYAPPSAIIDSKGDAVYFTGNTGKYLQPTPGEARLNIIDMAREGLKTDLRSLISKVRKTKKTEFKKGINVRTNGSIEVVDLCIRQFAHMDQDAEYLLITFEESKIKAVKSSKSIVKSVDEVSELHALEQELSATKEYLRTTIEQLEISNEELKAANEELQSSNEELQSTNEELETSKEELQSVNEEIVTVNTELQGKIDELGQAYDDMSNLLSSTAIGTVFLDAKFKIKRFTPAMSRIVNLINTDVGRSLTDLSSNLIYDGLLKDIKSVLETLTPVKKVVKNADGAWYQMQVMPYKTSENVIEGAVLTFVNITQEYLMSEELSKYKQNFEHLMEITKTVVYTQDKNLSYTSIANIHANLEFKNCIGKTDKEVFGPENAKKLDALKKGVLKTKIPVRETILMTIGKKDKYYDLTVRPVYEGRVLAGIACTSTDITELVEAEKQLSRQRNMKNES